MDTMLYEIRTYIINFFLEKLYFLFYQYSGINTKHNSIQYTYEILLYNYYKLYE